MVAKKQIFYGLVLVGGQSSRMKKNKALLNYHGRPQFAYCHDLLSKFCTKIYLSGRKEQNKKFSANKFFRIDDLKQFIGIGPLAGILSAMQKYPKAVWLVLGCDLPFVTEKILKNLISKRDPHKIATAYISAYDQLPEPLCAIYEVKGRKHLLRFLKKGITCPRKIMIHSDIKLLKPLSKHSLDNINDVDEYRSAFARLKKNRKD